VRLGNTPGARVNHPAPRNMSGSEADIPSEATLSLALRDVVVDIYKSGNTDDLTVKRVRARAEAKLGLPDGFFKHEDWKQKSQELIHEAVVRIYPARRRI